MERTLSISAVKTQLPELLDEIQANHERVIITYFGKPVAVLLAAEDWPELLEDPAVSGSPI